MQQEPGTDSFTFGTSNLYKYNNLDIGSEDLVKDLYFASSHYDKKACFAVGEIFNQGRYGIKKEDLEINEKSGDNPIKRLDNEIQRKIMSVEPSLNKYKGLHNLEKNGNDIRNSTWGSAICGITNHDTSYYPHNEYIHEYMGKFCPMKDTRNKKGVEPKHNKMKEFKNKNGCSVVSFTKLNLSRDTIYWKSVINGKNQISSMPFKEGLFFKHDINDIKNRYVTNFIVMNKKIEV